MSAGQELQLTLDSNPTTGYSWALDGEIAPQLEQVGEAEYTAESTALGAGGTEVWTFKAKSSGSGTLRLKYWRSFEPDATPPETFDVTVEVD
jgi:inhibitor of cysteine peptidase